MLYKINDKDNNEHFILIVAEDVKVSINGSTRFVHYTDKAGVEGIVFGSDIYDLVNFNNDNTDMHVGVDCTTAESFIINSELFNSLEKEVIRFRSINDNEIEDSILKNAPHLYLKDGSESKEMLDMIDKFLVSVQECLDSNAATAYLDESQSRSVRGWLYKFESKPICIRIIDKADKLHVIDWSTHRNEIFRASGYAVGLTETGLIKIKCTSHVDGYVYTR